ncbi:MAG: cyclic nucleotide-binding domain-containing protein [Halothece sp. Uz-M2-17]|nr:cyclic nucleotide-binding domain-containing protein [Halothece sp. Uz-M2-17]
MHQAFIQVFGNFLSTAELERYSTEFDETIKPKVGRFWQLDTAPQGIYLIVQGKIRLLNQNDELVTTLEASSYFGEATLFPKTAFHTYRARASLNTELIFLSQEFLSPLLTQYPDLEKEFYNKAKSREALISELEESEDASFQPEMSYPAVTDQASTLWLK